MHTEDNLPKQRKIIDYKIIIPSGDDDGEDKFKIYQNSIVEQIKNGWAPFGGIMACPSGENIVRFFQAMVKYED